MSPLSSVQIDREKLQMITRSLIAGSIFMLLAAPAIAKDEPAAESGENLMVKTGQRISVEYTLTLDDGTVADSNVGSAALVYVQGARRILPALEDALLGLKVGDSKTVALSPADGYGEIDPELYHDVAPGMIPEESRVAGAMLTGEDKAGNRREVRIHEVHDHWIVLDFNHPLAGKTLEFEVKILAIEDPSLPDD